MIRTTAPCVLVVARHVEAHKNLKKIHGGGNQQLTDAGVRQVGAMATAVNALLTTGDSVSIAHQPEGRCENTAFQLGAIVGSNPFVVRALRGVRMGVTEGLSDEEIRVRYPEIAQAQDDWRSGHAVTLPTVPGSEGLQDFSHRILSGIRQLVSEPAGAVVLICTTSTINMVSHLLRFDGVLTQDRYEFENFQLAETRRWLLTPNRPPDGPAT